MAECSPGMCEGGPGFNLWNHEEKGKERENKGRTKERRKGGEEKEKERRKNTKVRYSGVHV